MPARETNPGCAHGRDGADESRSAAGASRCLRIRIITAAIAEAARLRALIAPHPDLVVVGTTQLDERGAAPWAADVDVVVVAAGEADTADISELVAWVEGPLVVVGVDHVDLERLPPDTCGVGLLTREASAEELAAAIHAVARRLLVVDPRLIEPATARPDGRSQESVDPLSPRELDVLRRMAEGWPNKEIARELGISEHTVKYHVSAILSKLGARSRTEAVAVAARRGLIAL